MGEIYGYARVSTKDQSEDWQVNELKEFGVSAEKIFVDRQSGKDFNRPQYKKLLRKLKSDSVLVVKSIDRLGRNYAEILEQWRIITKKKERRSSYSIRHSLTLVTKKIFSAQSLPIWYFSLCRHLHKWNATPLNSGKRQALP